MNWGDATSESVGEVNLVSVLWFMGYSASRQTNTNTIINKTLFISDRHRLLG